MKKEELEKKEISTEESELSKEEKDLEKFSFEDFIENVDLSVNKIRSYFSELKTFLETEDTLCGRMVRFERTFSSKITTMIEDMLKLEKKTNASFINEYHTDLIPHTNHISLNEEEEIVEIMERFFSHFYSISDIFAKFVFEIYFKDSNTNIRGLGEFYSLLNKKKLTPKIQEIFRMFISERTELNNTRKYRNYLIHHGKLKLFHIREDCDERGYRFLSYSIPTIEKKGNEYIVSNKEEYPLNEFIRISLLLLMDCFGDTLRRLMENFYNAPPIK